MIDKKKLIFGAPEIEQREEGITVHVGNTNYKDSESIAYLNVAEIRPQCPRWAVLLKAEGYITFSGDEDHPFRWVDGERKIPHMADLYYNFLLNRYSLKEFLNLFGMMGHYKSITNNSPTSSTKSPYKLPDCLRKKLRSMK